MFNNVRRYVFIHVKHITVTMNDPTMPTRRLNCTIPPDVFKMLLDICKKEDRTQSNILKRLIIQEHERQKKVK